MITEEQIKNLKEGDPIIIHTKFKYVDEDGDVNFVAPYSYGGETCCFISSKFVSLPSEKPKYDPTRLFKKGDKVKPAERHGRKTPKLNYKAEYTVTSSEDDYGTVCVEYFNGEMPVSVSVPFYWLELVNPVEELELYSVRHNEAHAAWSIYGPYNLSAVNYFYGERYPYTEESAKAAAEAECDRLNAEWRKEHNND